MPQKRPQKVIQKRPRNALEASPEKFLGGSKKIIFCQFIFKGAPKILQKLPQKDVEII